MSPLAPVAQEPDDVNEDDIAGMNKLHSLIRWNKEPLNIREVLSLKPALVNVHSTMSSSSNKELKESKTKENELDFKQFANHPFPRQVNKYAMSETVCSYSLDEKIRPKKQNM